MTEILRAFRARPLPFILVLAAWFVYVGLLFHGATDGGSVKLSPTATNIIRASFAVPILIIWLVAVQAVIRVQSYARVIRESQEGIGFKWLSWGLMWLLVYIIVLFLIGRIAPLFTGTPSMLLAVFLKNHLPTYVLLVSSVMLYIGSSKLLAQDKKINLGSHTVIWLILQVFSALFVALFMMSPEHVNAADGSPLFALSHRELIFTLIIPSLVGWSLAVMGALNIYTYGNHVKGVIYRSALQRMAIGLYVSILFTIMVGLLVLNANMLLRVGLAGILLIVYAFIAAYGVGAVLIARGAKRLTLIEAAV